MKWISANQLRELDIAALFEALAAGDVSVEGYAYDELPKMKSYPREWEPALIQASERPNVFRPSSYYFLCAHLLVSIQSTWAGLPAFLVRLLDVCDDLPTFELIRRFAVQSSWNLPDSLRQKVVSAYSALPTWRRSLYKLDAPTKDLLRRCKECQAMEESRHSS